MRQHDHVGQDESESLPSAHGKLGEKARVSEGLGAEAAEFVAGKVDHRSLRQKCRFAVE
jgi:hypothetical protein